VSPKRPFKKPKVLTKEQKAAYRALHELHRARQRVMGVPEELIDEPLSLGIGKTTKHVAGPEPKVKRRRPVGGRAKV
jgi:hypothetical protein